MRVLKGKKKKLAAFIRELFRSRARARARARVTYGRVHHAA